MIQVRDLSSDCEHQPVALADVTVLKAAILQVAFRRSGAAGDSKPLPAAGSIQAGPRRCICFSASGSPRDWVPRQLRLECRSRRRQLLYLTFFAAAKNVTTTVTS